MLNAASSVPLKGITIQHDPCTHWCITTNFPLQ